LELAFVGLEPKDGNWWARANVFTMPSTGGEEHRLTHGTDPSDGCEYSPDGEWIYFNTEGFSPGHAQIARMRCDGFGLEQLTFDERVNWFPHLAPDGAYAVYLSFPSGTRGHPAGLHVELCLVQNDWTKALWRIPVFGGQGTINVNSWAPNSDRFAFVSYAD
jgi:Tol biopolymer transport system component